MWKSLHLEQYEEQKKTWPIRGCKILATYDKETIIVYQIVSEEVGKILSKQNTLHLKDDTFSKMIWLQTEFLGVMQQTNWGRNKKKEKILAIRMTRKGFEKILKWGMPTHFKKTEKLYSEKKEWKQELEKAKKNKSFVCFQFVPSKDCNGNGSRKRKALYFGLKGKILRKFIDRYVKDFEDITLFSQLTYVNFRKKKKNKILEFPIHQDYPLPDDLKDFLGMKPLPNIFGYYDADEAINDLDNQNSNENQNQN
ncbi:hypothetical protein M0811_05859 [Anaeramoeba ignava]|uniref:Uncharacterized protein n=1 Tax=Anaeramoeba ignava TaxID=1746090 RepID=A0A9Q0REN0_ANAIG|nr:hypothetical protein M0811_05859 [Anaeramoeba ignava]|eukprot:Anaeramoba_ignava/a370492_14.p1 GENE.a370492_14~~a370492_14.p1  ORF type:complete len:253 (-),score=78.10 a370492_14:22-780(-)